jgi:hypothetical protein
MLFDGRNKYARFGQNKVSNNENLIKILFSPSPINSNKKGSIPEALDKKAMEEFWQDSPLHQELRRAVQKQMTSLKNRNKELEERVTDLEEKVILKH